MFGAQVGYRIPFSDTVKLTLAGTYFDFDGVQGYNPFFGGSSFGNTTTTSAAVCSRTLAAGTACLALRLRHHRRLGGSHRVGGRQAAALLRRLRARTPRPKSIRWPTTSSIPRTAVGIAVRRASAAKGTWEVGLLYQKIEKDSLFGQLVDSDFGDGNTDTKGFVIQRRLHLRAQLDARTPRCS